MKWLLMAFIVLLHYATSSTLADVKPRFQFTKVPPPPKLQLAVNCDTKHWFVIDFHSCSLSQEPLLDLTVNVLLLGFNGDGGYSLHLDERYSHPHQFICAIASSEMLTWGVADLWNLCWARPWMSRCRVWWKPSGHCGCGIDYHTKSPMRPLTRPNTSPVCLPTNLFLQYVFLDSLLNAKQLTRLMANHSFSPLRMRKAMVTTVSR